MSFHEERPPAPRVSVLMTVYNAKLYLLRTLESLLAQTFQDWELVVVENGSSDGSAELLGQFADPRIRAIGLTQNIGRTPALRRAFDEARGEYFAVLDADDIALPERLARQVDYLDSHPEVVLLGTWADYVDEADVVFGGWTPRTEREALIASFGSVNPIVHSSAMYRATAARSVGGYPLDAPYGQDFALWLKLLDCGDPGVLPERLCQFRVQAQSMTRARRYRVAASRDLLNLMITAGRYRTLTTEERRRNREEVAIARVRYAVALAGSGRVLAGTWAACHAVLHDPISLVSNRITRGLLSK
jgi:glycosyltransferase involved in cell wall biosynthesis